MSRPANSIEKLNAAKRSMYRTRAEWLVAIAQGVATVADIVEVAREDERLAHLSLRQVLAAQPGWSMARATRAIEAMKRWDPGTRARPDKKLTLRWASGTAYWHDHLDLVAEVLIASRRETPAGGFPFEALPES